MRTADVRYYFDADILGLGKVLASLRPDITFPGDKGAEIHKRRREPCPITTPRAKDTEWIPTVSARGWLIVTRDANIVQHSAEISAVMENNGRLVALAGREAGSTWAQLEVVMSQWRKIEGLTGVSGPFVYSASRSGLRKVA